MAESAQQVDAHGERIALMAMHVRYAARIEPAIYFSTFPDNCWALRINLIGGLSSYRRQMPKSQGRRMSRILQMQQGSSKKCTLQDSSVPITVSWQECAQMIFDRHSNNNLRD